MFRHHRLSNGLTIIGEERPSAVSVAFGFFVRTGARDEVAAVSGVSHFLEHMMFKGTASRSALDISYQLGRLGAQANAYTSEENTVYYMAILPEFFERGVELLSDMLRPALDPTEFDTEKKVILEEIALYQDRPTYVLFEAAIKQFFSGHVAGNSVLGSNDSITNLSRDMMKEYFDSRYVPSNIVLSATGNFSWDTLLTLAERYCGRWKDAVADRALPKHTPSASEKTLTKEGLKAAHLALVTQGPSAVDVERYAASVLSCILGDSTGSRCFWELIDKGLADSASVDVDEMDGTGMVYGYVSSYPDRLDEVGEILSKIMSNAGDFSDDELERAKTKIGTRLVLKGESSMRRLMGLGLGWVYRKEYESLEDELRAIKSVTRGSIEKLISRFPFRPVTRVRLLPAAG